MLTLILVNAILLMQPKRGTSTYSNAYYETWKSLSKFIKKNIDINIWICYITNATEKGAKQMIFEN